MSYQALYRKWRPAAFDGIAGQDAVVTTLKNQIRSDRIGHAYLFCGTRGTGKTSAAKIFAKAVNCPHAAEHDGNPCNTCEVCTGIASGRAMNVFEIDAASNNGVDNIRDIRDQVEYPPVTGRYKVYIIDEVHMLSTGAFNALLKTLEEPPSYVIFILATTDPQKIPATVLSRCQRYDFRRIGKKCIAEHLRDITEREGVKVEPKALDYIAGAADGSMRDSLSLLDQCLAYHYGEVLTYEHVLEILGAADTGVFSELLRRIAAQDAEGAVGLVSELTDAGREVNQLINDFLWYLRNVLLVKSTVRQDMLELSDEAYSQAAADAELADRDGIIRIITAMAELANRLRFSPQKRVQLEVELIRLCVPSQTAAAARTAADAAAYTSPVVSVREIPKTAAASDGAAAGRKPAGVQTGTAAGAYSAAAGKQGSGTTAGAAEAELPWDTAPQSGAAGGIDPSSAKIRVNISDPGAGTGTAPKLPAPDHGTDIAPAGVKEAAGRPEPVSGRTAGRPQDTANTAAPVQGEPQGSMLELVRQNWDRLVGSLSASNRPLFNGVMLKEERGGIVLVFKNKVSFNLAASNTDENGVVRLRELAQPLLGVRINFMARQARPGEMDTEPARATDEELARINFPVTFED